MNRSLLLITMLAGFLLIGTPSKAQDYDESFRANPRYEDMTRTASRYQSDNFRFDLYRGFYKDTRQYDPIADDIIEKMFEYSYIVQNEEDKEKSAAALKAYQDLVLQHMANLRVVAQALSLSKLDPRFGNPSFFHWVLRGLIGSVKATGDGNSLQGAYDVITLSEETVLIGQLGMKLVGTKSAHEGYYHYNMHEVEDLETGQKSTVFVNTTIPMRFLEKKQKDLGKTIIIPKQ